MQERLKHLAKYEQEHVVTIKVSEKDFYDGEFDKWFDENVNDPWFCHGVCGFTWPRDGIMTVSFANPMNAKLYRFRCLMKNQLTDEAQSRTERQHSKKRQKHMVFIEKAKASSDMLPWLDENIHDHRWSVHRVVSDGFETEEELMFSFSDLATATLFRLRF